MPPQFNSRRPKVESESSPLVASTWPTRAGPNQMNAEKQQRFDGESERCGYAAPVRISQTPTASTTEQSSTGVNPATARSTPELPNHQNNRTAAEKAQMHPSFSLMISLCPPAPLLPAIFLSAVYSTALLSKECDGFFKIAR